VGHDGPEKKKLSSEERETKKGAFPFEPPAGEKRSAYIVRGKKKKNETNFPSRF